MNPNNLPKGFDEFWQAYPRQRRVGKGAAVRAFIKVGGQDVLPDILKDLKRRVWPDEAQYIPHPATYLNQWRWLDEIETGPTEDDPEYWS